MDLSYDTKLQGMSPLIDWDSNISHRLLVPHRPDNHSRWSLTEENGSLHPTPPTWPIREVSNHKKGDQSSISRFVELHVQLCDLTLYKYEHYDFAYD